MQEFIAGFFKSFQERLNTTLYGAFLLALIVWNYDIFLTIFFVSNESIIDLEGLTKAMYIRDILYPTIWGVDLYLRFGDILGRILVSIYHVGVPIVLTYLMIWHIPKLGTKAHKKEKEFLNQRERENIDSQENLAEYRLTHMTHQDALLSKEEMNEDRRKELLRLKKENIQTSKKIAEDDSNNINTTITLSNNELKIYKKITEDSTILNTFSSMLPYIQKDNQVKATRVDESGIGNEKYEPFSQFSSNDLIGYQYIEKPIGETEAKLYLYLKDLGKKIARQMVKDGYIKEEDLEGKI